VGACMVPIAVIGHRSRRRVCVSVCLCVCNLVGECVRVLLVRSCDPPCPFLLSFVVAGGCEPACGLPCCQVSSWVDYTLDYQARNFGALPPASVYRPASLPDSGKVTGWNGVSKGGAFVVF
jgi:hypothetical protein